MSDQEFERTKASGQTEDVRSRKILYLLYQGFYKEFGCVVSLTIHFSLLNSVSSPSYISPPLYSLVIRQEQIQPVPSARVEQVKAIFSLVY